MARLLIIVAISFAFTQVQAQSRDLGLFIPVTAESGNEIFARFLNHFKNKLREVKNNSDARIYHENLVLDYSKIRSCDFQKIILSPKTHIRPDQIIEILNFQICGENITSFILDRMGTDLFPMDLEDIINADFPLRSTEKHWHLKNSHNGFSVLVQGNGINKITRFSGHGCEFKIEEVILSHRLQRRYQAVCEPSLPAGVLTFEVDVHIHPHEFFPSVYYRSGQVQLDAMSFNSSYTGYMSFLKSIMYQLFVVPKILSAQDMMF